MSSQPATLRRSAGAFGLLIAGAALASCGSPQPHLPVVSSASPGTTAPPTGTGKTLECSYTPVNDLMGTKNPGLPPQPGPGPTTATFTTSAGTFVVMLDASKAPCTTSSFRHLAEVGFFDKTHCPRLTTSGIYVLQCGDPTGTGAGGPGYTIPDENLAGATYPAGTVAMANTGAPHSGGSQFFIVYKDSMLAPSYTPFGKVTSGLSVIKRVAAGGAPNTNPAGGGPPKIPVNISTVKMS
ncbi:MAG: peptidylprolyl isomerase [Acidimicrobiales bacterium]